MNAHEYRQRTTFLALKAKTLGLSADEQKELAWLQSIRITETTSGVVIIAPMPMNLDEWKAQVQRSRGIPCALLADNDHKNT